MAATRIAPDDIVVAYHAALGLLPVKRIARIGLCRLSSAALLRSCFDEVESHDELAYDTAAQLQATVLGNANIDADFVLAHLDDEPHVVRVAAASSSALDRDTVIDLWLRTSNEWFLANPNMPRRFLTDNATRHPAAVGSNPNASEAALRRCYRSSAGRFAVLTNPRCPVDLLDDTLAKASRLDAWVRQQPLVSPAQLERLERRILLGGQPGMSHIADAESRKRLAGAVRVERKHREQMVRLADAPVSALRRMDVPDVLADVLCDAGVVADAVISLLGAGFDGSISELIEVGAATVGAHS